jgi:uncharacterized protein YndB with AHSA1/START domain
MATTSTRLSRHMNAPRARVYSALLDARAVETWMVPGGMTKASTLVSQFEGWSLCKTRSKNYGHRR